MTFPSSIFIDITAVYDLKTINSLIHRNEWKCKVLKSLVLLILENYCDLESIHSSLEFLRVHI